VPRPLGSGEHPRRRALHHGLYPASRVFLRHPPVAAGSAARPCAVRSCPPQPYHQSALRQIDEAPERPGGAVPRPAGRASRAGGPWAGAKPPRAARLLAPHLMASGPPFVLGRRSFVQNRRPPRDSASARLAPRRRLVGKVTRPRERPSRGG